MTDRPEPMTAPDCNLRGLPWMPLETGRLLDSDLFLLSTGDEFKAAVALWCKSWNQIPGGSLPNDERLLEALSGSKVWKKVREMAMRGWVLCSDGRLYHPVVAEQAAQAWEGRQGHMEVVDAKKSRQQRWRDQLKELSAKLRAAGVTPPMNASKTELERLVALHVDGHVDASPSTEVSTSSSHVDATETANKGEGQRQGQLIQIPEPIGSVGKPDALPVCPTQAVIDLYHEVLPELPRVRLLNDKRRRDIGQRWRWVLTSKKADQSRRAVTAEQALNWFREYFDRARENDFLMGRGLRSGEHANWQCDIDFLLSERGMKHVIEKTRGGA